MSDLARLHVSLEADPRLSKVTVVNGTILPVTIIGIEVSPYDHRNELVLRIPLDFADIDYIKERSA